VLLDVHLSTFRRIVPSSKRQELNTPQYIFTQTEEILSTRSVRTVSLVSSSADGTILGVGNV